MTNRELNIGASFGLLFLVVVIFCVGYLAMGLADGLTSWVSDRQAAAHARRTTPTVVVCSVRGESVTYHGFGAMIDDDGTSFYRTGSQNSPRVVMSPGVPCAMVEDHDVQ